MRHGGLGGYGGYEITQQSVLSPLTGLRRVVGAECSRLDADFLLRKLCWSSGQALDAFRDGGMRREQAAEVHSQEWLNDK